MVGGDPGPVPIIKFHSRVATEWQPRKNYPGCGLVVASVLWNLRPLVRVPLHQEKK